VPNDDVTVEELGLMMAGERHPELEERLEQPPA
jgi:hypothetical protein